MINIAPLQLVGRKDGEAYAARHASLQLLDNKCIRPLSRLSFASYVGYPFFITAFTRRLSGPAHRQAPSHSAPYYFTLPRTMKAKEHWSVLDKGRLRRRLSVRARIDHFLDRLVDIFDFPVEPPAYSQSVSAVPTRKHSTSTAGGLYTTMDENSSPRTRARGNTSDSIHKPCGVSMTDRFRGILRSSKSASSKSKSMPACNWSKRSNNVPEPRELRMSWFLETNITSLREPRDELWIECEEPERQLVSSYQYLADEATI
ncbi:hypothetical protein ON010_g71 [Phytophthora cinnamomi]|nr:hypothetical protein ON010_g71 [Phytophthora cinnamomi]